MGPHTELVVDVLEQSGLAQHRWSLDAAQGVILVDDLYLTCREQARDIDKYAQDALQCIKHFLPDVSFSILPRRLVDNIWLDILIGGCSGYSQAGGG